MGLIRANLEKLGFDQKQVERMAPLYYEDVKYLTRDGQKNLSEDFFNYDAKLNRTAALLGVDRALLLQAANYERGVLVRDGQTMLDNAKAACDALHVPLPVYLTAILPVHAQVFSRPGATIENNVIGSAEGIGLTVDEYVGLALKQPALFLQTKDKTLKIVEETSKKLWLTQSQYIDAAKKEPSLLYKNPDTTLKNVESCARSVDLSLESYIAAVRKQKQEQLFSRSGETFRDNIEKASTLLDIDRETFTKAAKKRLTILAYDPQTLNDKIDDMSAYLKVSRDEALKACLSSPILFTLDMKEIDKNVTRLAELLDVDKDRLAKKLVREGPNALYQDPETINGRIEKVCELTGLDKRTYVEMATNKVNLLWRAPEAVARNFQLLHLFGSKGVIGRNVEEFYKTKPDILAVSPTNFHLRYLYARAAGLQDLGSFGLLREPRAKIERSLVEKLGYDPDATTITRPVKRGDHQPRNEKHHGAFVGLISRGILSQYKYEPAAP